MLDKYDITPEGRYDEIQDALEWALGRVGSVCLLQSWGPCRGPLVDGHIVQEAKQKLFAENNRVRTFDEPPFRQSLEMRQRGKLALPRLVKTGVSTVLEFSCQHHDKVVFAHSEDREINIATLGQDITLALDVLAYKSACGHLAKTRRSALAWEMLRRIWPNDPKVAAIEFYEHHRWIKAADAHALMEQVLLDTGEVNMLHSVTETSKKASIAANGYYPVINPRIGASAERTVGIWSPKFVTAYPTRMGQFVITSWVQSPPTPRPLLVKRVGDGKPQDRHFSAILASIALVQDCETITMSPSAWSAIPEFKRRAIVNYYEACRPTVPNEIEQATRPPSEWLNLFGTSPLRDL